MMILPVIIQQCLHPFIISVIFLWFPVISHDFPMIFMWFPVIFCDFLWFPVISHDFPVIFLWFWCNFPWFSCDFLWFWCNFPWFSCEYSVISRDFGVISRDYSVIFLRFFFDFRSFSVSQEITGFRVQLWRGADWNDWNEKNMFSINFNKMPVNKRTSYNLNILNIL